MCVWEVWRRFGVLETSRTVVAVVKMSVPKQLNKLAVNVSKSKASQFNSPFCAFLGQSCPKQYRHNSFLLSKPVEDGANSSSVDTEHCHSPERRSRMPVYVCSVDKMPKIVKWKRTATRRPKK